MSAATLLTSFLITLGYGSVDRKPNDIVIVPTLHQLHNEVTNYGFEQLRETLEALKPDILVVELTPSDLEERKHQPNKQEYQEAVFPYADEHDIPMVAMEPSQPLFDEILGPYIANGKQVAEEHAERVEAFGEYLSLFYERISDDHIKSVRDLTSPKFEELARLKHEFQIAVYGEGEETGWNAWNQHFFDTIARVDAENEGKRIVVVVGYEHHYWLKEALTSARLPVSDW